MILEEECGFCMTNYGDNFISAVQKDNVFGLQFHPEKSRADGLQVIKNFINWNK